MSGLYLVAAHEAVLDAVGQGLPARLGPPAGAGEATGVPGGGAGAREPGSPATELPPYHDDEAWAGRTVDGGWLASLLTGGGRIHERGITLHGARILGGLDLDGADLRHRIELVGCQLGPHPLALRDARTRTVRLSGVRCGGIDAERAQIGGALVLTGSVVVGPLRLMDARVDASVGCYRTRTEARGAAAVDADRATIAGSLLLQHGFVADGGVRLQAATVGGVLDATGARLTARHRGALVATGAEVAGSLILRRGFEARGEVELQGVRVGRDVVCSDASFTNRGGVALGLDGARIGGSVLLRRSDAAGQVRLVNSDVGGDLRCGGARLTGDDPETEVLSASRARIAGEVFLDQGFVAEGRVRFRGAAIGGSLRCGSARLTAPGSVALDAASATVGADVWLDDGFTAHGQVSLGGATVGGGVGCGGARIEVGGGEDPALELRGARVTTNVLLNEGFTAEGSVRFTGASIGGELNCQRGRVLNPTRYALHGSGAVIGGTVHLGGFEAEGQLRLLSTTIGRDLFAVDCTVTAPHGDALRGTRAQITGDLILGRGFVSTGKVQVVGAAIGGNLDCGGGTFRARGGPALDASQVEVGGAVLFSEASAVEGELRLGDATVGGSLDLGRVRVQSVGDSPAIDASNARVTGALHLGGAVSGLVRLTGINVGGDLRCAGARLVATAGDQALRADRAQIAGAVLLNDGFTAQGGVQMRRTTVGGHVSCRTALLSCPDRAALNLFGSRIGGDVLLTEGFRAEGETVLAGASVGNDVSCSGGSFTVPRGRALDLVGAHVTGTVFLDDGFDARGAVRLSAAEVGGNVYCRGGRFTSDDRGRALVAAGARIGGTLTMDGGFRAEGLVVLLGATVGTLEDESTSWPDLVDLDGFRYDRLVCPPADRGWRARRAWLRRQSTPSAQGYVQLAAVYRAAGDELDARRILIERHNTLLRPPATWRSELPTGPRDVIGRVRRWVLRLTIGHGYAPGRSLLIAVPLVAGLALWLNHARDQDMLIPTDETAVTVDEGAPRASGCDGTYPCVEPVVYAVDNMVPIVDLGQRSRWTPDQSHRGASWTDNGRLLAAATWATSALGWALATLVAASFTQVIRRE